MIGKGCDQTRGGSTSNLRRGPRFTRVSAQKKFRQLKSSFCCRFKQFNCTFSHFNLLRSETFLDKLKNTRIFFKDRESLEILLNLYQVFQMSRPRIRIRSILHRILNTVQNLVNKRVRISGSMQCRFSLQQFPDNCSPRLYPFSHINLQLQVQVQVEVLGKLSLT